MDKESHDFAGLSALVTVGASTRVLQGFLNSVAHLQRSIYPLFNTVRECVKSYLGELIVHAKTEVNLLNELQRFIRIFHDQIIFISATKTKYHLNDVT